MPTDPDALRTWLGKAGYPFELRVGAVLRKAGWEIEHGAFYLDSETGKSREIDLVATRRVIDVGARSVPGGSPNNFAAVRLVIECKTSVHKPWVVFSAPGGALRVNSLFSTPRGVDELSQRCTAALGPMDEGAQTLLGPSLVLAHGITRAFSDGKPGDPSSPYAALRGSLSAALAMGTDALHRARRLATTRGWAELIFPVVVVDGELFQYAVDEQGVESLDILERCSVVMPSPKDGSVVVVEVMTFIGLEKFAIDEGANVSALLNGLVAASTLVARSLAEESSKSSGSADG